MNPLAPYVQIREALEEAEAAIHDWTLGSERPRDNEFVYMRASIEYRAGTLAKLKAALQALEAQEAGMTDEEISELARLHVQSYMQAYSSHDHVHAIIAVRELLTKVRDQGYRLPKGRADQ